MFEVKPKKLGETQDAWQNRNEIAPFTPKHLFYGVSWITSTNIFKLGGNARSK